MIFKILIWTTQNQINTKYHKFNLKLRKIEEFIWKDILEIDIRGSKLAQSYWAKLQVIQLACLSRVKTNIQAETTISLS